MTIKKYYPLNQFIKVPQLRVLDEAGKQLGILPTPEALSKARAANLDLVVITENAKPPVAKIIDFQKFKYQQSKKERSGAVKSKATSTKEVRFTPFMAANDFQIRLNRASEFLTDGYRVKLVVKFQGRQITRKEFGENMMVEAIKKLSNISQVDQAPKWQGKLYLVQLKPTKPQKHEDQK